MLLFALVDAAEEAPVGVAALDLRVGRLADELADPLRCLLVVREVGHTNVAVIENRVVRPIGGLQLVQRLRDQEGLDAVAGDEGQLRFEERELSKRRELVEQEEEHGGDRRV